MGAEVERHPNPENEAITETRRLKITMKTLREHGTTDGCPQCVHVRAFGEAKSGLIHSEPCRKRILEAMSATPAGAARIQKQKVRAERHDDQVNQRLVELSADHFEAADRARRDGEPDHPPPEAPPAGAAGAAEPMRQAHGAEAETPSDDESRCPRDSDDEMAVMTVAELRKRIKTEAVNLTVGDRGATNILAPRGATNILAPRGSGSTWGGAKAPKMVLLSLPPARTQESSSFAAARAWRCSQKGTKLREPR